MNLELHGKENEKMNLDRIGLDLKRIESWIEKGNCGRKWKRKGMRKLEKWKEVENWWKEIRRTGGGGKRKEKKNGKKKEKWKWKKKEEKKWEKWMRRRMRIGLGMAARNPN